MKRVYAKYVVILLFIQCCFLVPMQASILAKSSINQCTMSTDVKAGNGKVCSKMLVVALTVTGNEVCMHTCIISVSPYIKLLQGKSRYMQADVKKVVDNTNPKKAKNVQLQYPIRIKVKKSPVLIHFDMHKVTVSVFNIQTCNS